MQHFAARPLLWIFENTNNASLDLRKLTVSMPKPNDNCEFFYHKHRI